MKNKNFLHKVVMLPTKERSDIVSSGSKTNTMVYINSKMEKTELNGSETYNHLYFLSNDKVKKGEWCYNELHGNICKVESFNKSASYYKKIIATTDLLADENTCRLLPRPSDRFVKYYCERVGIDEVMIEYENIVTEYGDLPYWKLKVNPDNTINITIKGGWNSGSWL